MSDLTRRDVLKRGAAASLPLLIGGVPRVAFGHTPPPAPGTRKPLPADLFIPQGTNAEMRWSAMRGQGYFTPTDRFFVRNHTSTPAIDPETWRLSVFGSGLRNSPARDTPVRFSLADLQNLPDTTVI